MAQFSLLLPQTQHSNLNPYATHTSNSSPMAPSKLKRFFTSHRLPRSSASSNPPPPPTSTPTTSLTSLSSHTPSTTTTASTTTTTTTTTTTSSSATSTFTSTSTSTSTSSTYTPSIDHDRLISTWDAESLIRSFLADHWPSHADYIRVECDLTLPELRALGRLPRAEGERACRRLVRVPVIWEEVAGGLWVWLAAGGAEEGEKGEEKGEEYRESEGEESSVVEDGCSVVVTKGSNHDNEGIQETGESGGMADRDGGNWFVQRTLRVKKRLRIRSRYSQRDNLGKQQQQQPQPEEEKRPTPGCALCSKNCAAYYGQQHAGDTTPRSSREAVHQHDQGGGPCDFWQRADEVPRRQRLVEDGSSGTSRDLPEPRSVPAWTLSKSKKGKEGLLPFWERMLLHTPLAGDGARWMRETWRVMRSLQDYGTQY